MRLLLDTHTFLWVLDDAPRLGPRTRALITERGNDVFVSIVSLWEIVLKADRLKADIPRILEAVEPSGFTLLALSTNHLMRQHEIKGRFSDPFDGLLVAQADCERCSLVTADDVVLSDPPVDLIECRTGRRVRAKAR